MMEEEEEEEMEVGGRHCCSSLESQPESRRRTGASFVSPLASLLVLSLLHLAGSIPIGKEKPRAVGSAEAWRPPASFPGFVFPEQMDSDAGGRGMLAGRYKSAVCFSGGGLRSFIASIGYLAALEDLGLMDEIGYTTGVSGGSWATVLYSYYKRGSDGIAKTDSELLGEVPLPENITMAWLKRIPPKCARRSAATGLLREILAQTLADSWRWPPDLGGVWRDSISRVFLEPYGIQPNKPYAWDAQAASNRSGGMFSPDDYQVPRPEAPLPVVAFSMLGPLGSVPLASPRQYVMLESTPAYVGAAMPSRNITYSRRIGRGKQQQQQQQQKQQQRVEVGGLIEPQAFGGLPPAAAAGKGGGGLAQGVVQGVIQGVEMPERPFSLRDLAGSSSYAPGGFFASSPLFPLLGQWIGVHYDYWSPISSSPRATRAVFADGGDMESPHLMGMLLRGVKHAVVFLNFATPLQPSSGWDPHARAPTSRDVDDDFPPFFGTTLDDWGGRTSYDFSRNQAFNQSDFAWVVEALQLSQASGRGAVATTELVTVANEWWGLEAGFKVTVTWVYLSRASRWEEALPPEVRALAVPTGSGGADVTRGRSGGPFAGFPYYSTGRMFYDEGNTNLLAALSGWVVAEHAGEITANVRMMPINVYQRGPGGRAVLARGAVP